MATVLTPGFGPIVLACQQQLFAQVSLLTINPYLVLIVGNDEAPRMQADFDCILRPGGYLSVAPTYDVAGRQCTKIVRSLHLYPRCRLALDSSDRDDIRLTHASLGFFQFEEACVNALHGFFPRDSSDNHLTYEELRITNATDPMRSLKDDQWMLGHTAFEVAYLFNLQDRPWSPPLITTTSLASGTSGVAYSQTISTQGGGGTNVFTSLGTLPDGLSVSSGGIVSGTPTAAGDFTFIVVVTDANGQRGAAQYSVTIA